MSFLKAKIYLFSYIHPFKTIFNLLYFSPNSRLPLPDHFLPRWDCRAITVIVGLQSQHLHSMQIILKEKHHALLWLLEAFSLHPFMQTSFSLWQLLRLCPETLKCWRDVWGKEELLRSQISEHFLMFSFLTYSFSDFRHRFQHSCALNTFLQNHSAYLLGLSERYTR